MEEITIDVPDYGMMTCRILAPQTGKLGRHGWIITDVATGEIVNSCDLTRQKAIDSVISYIKHGGD